MDIYERLIQDHEKQRKLCKQLLNTDGATEERADLWHALKVELDAHASAEEQAFYSFLMKKPDGTDEARHSVHEHQEMTKLTKELSELDQGSGGWMNKYKKLQHKIIHHLDEEENDIFPAAKKLINADTAKALASTFETRKAAEVDKEEKATA